MTYVFTCFVCEQTVEQPTREAPDCVHGHGSMNRDWQKEGVQVDRGAFRQKSKRRPSGTTELV